MTEPRDKSQIQMWLSGLLFGIVFGFLLHKSGVSDYNVLIGVLRLTDLTVIRVILSAVVSGSIAVFLLKRLGWVRPHVKPAHYANNVFGGLVFGVGFGLWGYCPGTGAAALGQASWDAIFGIVGMVVGSYVYALAYPRLKRLSKAGDKGELTVARLLHINEGVYLSVSSALIILFLWLIHS